MPDVPLDSTIVHMFFLCQAWLVLIFWWGEGRGREGGLRGNERSLDSARDDGCGCFLRGDACWQREVPVRLRFGKTSPRREGTEALRYDPRSLHTAMALASRMITQGRLSTVVGMTVGSVGTTNTQSADAKGFDLQRSPLGSTRLQIAGNLVTYA
jgi:hypothetical protein